jgi:hypothetical protein
MFSSDDDFELSLSSQRGMEAGANRKRKGMEDEIGELLKETMEHVVELRVPVKVEIHGAKSWGEMK